MFEVDTRKELERVYAELYRDAHGTPGEADPAWTVDDLQSAIRVLEASINTQLGLDESDATEEPEGAWACSEQDRDEWDSCPVNEVEEVEEEFQYC